MFPGKALGYLSGAPYSDSHKPNSLKLITTVNSFVAQNYQIFYLVEVKTDGIGKNQGPVIFHTKRQHQRLIL
jgi:hypothetical protein